MKKSLIAAVFGILASVTTASAHVAVDTEYLARLGLHEGDIVGSSNPGDPDIYIMNSFGFKRLFVSPAIFGFYGHLHYSDVRRFADTVIDSMPISALFRNCETDDQKVYALEVTGEDNAVLHWVNMSGQAAVSEDDDFFRRTFCINTRELDLYTTGTPYTHLAQVPTYHRATEAHGTNETTIALTVPAGLRISQFTPTKIGPLRFMAFSPDGILFVSMPSSTGLYAKGPNDGAIYALPDRDGDGKADRVITVLSGMHLPHGLVFHGGYLYVATEGQVWRYPYLNDAAVGSGQVIISNLPTGGEHLSRTIGFGANGKLYVSVGSSCNDCSPAQAGTGAIWEYNADGTGGRIYARGMRNAVGIVLNQATGEMWGTENGRDFLGDDLPPDEINIIRDGGDYGWPKCYGAKVVDPLYHDPSFCQGTVASTFNLQAHSAPLGLRFIEGSVLPAAWAGDLLVARHGSWNRTQPVGYDIVRLDVQGNTIIGEYDFIKGWLTSANTKLGRPVDLLFGPDGALYISDDQADIIYRVSKAP